MNDTLKKGLFVLSIILVGCGIGMMVAGYGETEYDYKGIVCTLCDGYGCKFCNGVGSILGNDNTYSPILIFGLILLVVGVAIGIFLFKMPYTMEPSMPTYVGGIKDQSKAKKQKKSSLSPKTAFWVTLIVGVMLGYIEISASSNDFKRAYKGMLSFIVGSEVWISGIFAAAIWLIVVIVTSFVVSLIVKHSNSKT